MGSLNVRYSGGIREREKERAEHLKAHLLVRSRNTLAKCSQANGICRTSREREKKRKSEMDQNNCFDWLDEEEEEEGKGKVAFP